MFLTKGTKIQLTKPFMNGILRDGDIFEITNLDHNGIITFNAPFGTYVMSMDTFLKYFKVMEEEKKEDPKKRTWSDWEYDWFYFFDLDGDGYVAPIKFRENGKIVEMRTNYNDRENVKVRAFCNLKYDEFDFDKGLDVANARMTIKLLQKELDEMIAKM